LAVYIVPDVDDTCTCASAAVCLDRERTRTLLKEPRPSEWHSGRWVVPLDHLWLMQRGPNDPALRYIYRVGRHRAVTVQYIRPEIVGFVSGPLVAALVFREFKPRTGSAPLVRFFCWGCCPVLTPYPTATIMRCFCNDAQMYFLRFFVELP